MQDRNVTFAHDHAVRIFDKLVATYVGFPERATHLNETFHAYAMGVRDTSLLRTGERWCLFSMPTRHQIHGFLAAGGPGIS